MPPVTSDGCGCGSSSFLFCQSCFTYLAVSDARTFSISKSSCRPSLLVFELSTSVAHTLLVPKCTVSDSNTAVPAFSVRWCASVSLLLFSTSLCPYVNEVSSKQHTGGLCGVCVLGGGCLCVCELAHFKRPLMHFTKCDPQRVHVSCLLRQWPQWRALCTSVSAFPVSRAHWTFLPRPALTPTSATWNDLGCLQLHLYLLMGG